MTKTNLLKCSLMALLPVPFSPALAETGNFEATVERTLVTTTEDAQGNVEFGGCMAQMSFAAGAPRPSGSLNCRDGWVTFSCSGNHTSKSNAMRLLDSAQLAFVTGRKVQVYVDDARKHNNWCFAYRIDVKGLPR